MTRTPLIAVTLHGEAREGVPKRFIRNRSYIEALENAGAAVVGIAPTSAEPALRRLYDLCDALLLPGGPDVEPQRYGDRPDTACNLECDPELDTLEFRLLDWARADDKPVLGICRGLQVLNVALGGTLWQDVNLQRNSRHRHPENSDRAALAHDLAVTPGTFLHRVTGDASVRVNSLHHQGVRELAAPLRAAATSADGLIEAVEESGRRFVAGVQWHPEEIADAAPWSPRLFSEFVAAAGG